MLPYALCDRYISDCLEIGFVEAGMRHAVHLINQIPLSAAGAKAKAKILFDFTVNKTAKDLRVSPCSFALQIDESVDRASCTDLVGWVRYVWNNTIHERVVFCIELKHRKTAADIFNAVRAFMEKHRILWHKLGSLCTDGAIVNTGDHTGVAERIKHMNPVRIYHVCFIHRMVLCIQDLPGGMKRTMEALSPSLDFLDLCTRCEKSSTTIASTQAKEKREFHTTARFDGRRARTFSRVYLTLGTRAKIFHPSSNSTLVPTDDQGNLRIIASCINIINEVKENIRLRREQNQASSYDLFLFLRAYATSINHVVGPEVYYMLAVLYYFRLIHDRRSTSMRCALQNYGQAKFQAFYSWTALAFFSSDRASRCET